MKQHLKADIISVKDLLEKRDPHWAHIGMIPKFKTLYSGWVAQQLRHNIRNAPFYSNAWKRGWLPIQDWYSFRDYAMQ